MTANKRKLYNDVSYLTGIHPPRNWKNLQSLGIIARHIENTFRGVGLPVQEQPWTARGNTYNNIIASYQPDRERRLVIGAHYDVAGDQPGADDNASGIAGLLELARLVAENKPRVDYRIDFAAYCLEEPPFFGTPEMGSYIHAQSLKEQEADLIGMICLEMIGYFSEAPGSQPNPEPELAPDLPDTGTFIAVAGIEQYRDFNEKVQQLMLENEQMDTCVIHFPSSNPYTGLSDQRNYCHFGYPAVMITDTAIIRNGHNYHQPTDTIDTLDFDRMSEAVNSIYLAVVGQ